MPDVSSDASVTAADGAIIGRAGMIHILVHHVGEISMGECGSRTLMDRPIEDVEEPFGTNVFRPMRVTKVPESRPTLYPASSRKPRPSFLTSRKYTVPLASIEAFYSEAEDTDVEEDVDDTVTPPPKKRKAGASSVKPEPSKPARKTTLKSGTRDARLMHDEDDASEGQEEPKAPDRYIPIEVYALDDGDRFARPPPHQLFLGESTDDIRHRGLPAAQEDDSGDFTMTVTLTIGDEVRFEMPPRPREVPSSLRMRRETRFHRHAGIVPVGIGELTFAPLTEGELGFGVFASVFNIVANRDKPRTQQPGDAVGLGKRPYKSALLKVHPKNAQMPEEY
ncbi:hypothetical protein AURDEDRAFT_178081 [Auricularia subglabra TFB-10046 SS5]|uniref:Uncharacterized protein n=1 Tax=Auricularia subglabra (strain TFB-10046 / SS5) TaxID=717982 RepID=J0L8X3_AURST|nr:hypothetical protein AURDEDRAFT_178081 [Auricularia subglabra TFB-10046 SS5]